MKQRVLIVEDDESILVSLKETLDSAGFCVAAARTVSETRTAFSSPQDLILLDLGLPDGEGFELLGELGDHRVPVIILTARDEEADVIRGLDSGADDYVTKPFQMSVLLSRMKAVLRRAGSSSEGDILWCGDIRLCRSSTEVMVGGKAVNLTAGEYRLLEYLLVNKNRTLTRSMLLEQLWDIDGDFVGDNALTVLIKRLREKLGGTPQRIIKTVRGIGYKAEDCDEK